LDVKLETTNGKVIDIEIQILSLPGMKERIVFYTSRMITDQISKGESYNVIKQAISIVITDYVLINGYSSAGHSRNRCDLPPNSA
jgi:predicted transposase/invertase (TIGR01784 family)